jgi:hypothetical protein
VQRARAFQCGCECLGVGEVARHHLDPGGQVGVRRIAGERAHAPAGAKQLIDDVPADLPGRPGYENRHGRLLSVRITLQVAA